MEKLISSIYAKSFPPQLTTTMAKSVKGSATITVWEKDALNQWMRKQSVDLLVPKLMYVLNPEQMLALIKLHEIKVGGPNASLMEKYPSKIKVKDYPRLMKAKLKKKK